MIQGAFVNTGNEYAIITGQTYDGVRWNRDPQPTAVLKPGESAALLNASATRRFLFEQGVPPPI